MTVGQSVAKANGELNVYRGTANTGVSVFVKLHVGDPGSAGTVNPSALTTRNAVTWSAPSGGSMLLAALSAYSMTATETVSHVSFWDAITAGNFLESAVLTTAIPVINGSTLTFSALTVSRVPLAA